ncbi:MAG: hypothetical protein IIW25_06585 [Bacteroidales bacterium]|nr:hypothetical protein [Bacteroidales bacterium]
MVANISLNKMLEESFKKNWNSPALSDYKGHGRAIPEILTSGNHEKVRQWRRKQALRRTRQRRPDMYEKLDLSSKQDKKLLKEMEEEDQA